MRCKVGVCVHTIILKLGPGVVAHTSTSGTQEVEADRSRRVPGQTGLYREF